FNPNVLKESYGLDCDIEEVFEKVGMLRGRLTKGGGVNIDEAARTILKDWIVGRIKYAAPPPNL
ncbi:MAG: GTP-binding protein, partial [Pyrobaculum sp.]